jgi:hypothetical protein
LPPGEVAIQWIDPNGNVWRSDGRVQESSAYFTVNESEPYENNEKGQKTRKMEVVFGCRLFNADGEAIEIFGGGVIAVAYP